MLSGYAPTNLEKKIEAMYRERGILSPADLDMNNVAKMFGMKINHTQGPQRAIWDDEDTSVIFLNPNQSLEKQREVFFHELGHPILHCGDQTKMKNEQFKKLQESQAHQFQLYAAIPFFMLKELELPSFEAQFINLISKEFKVSQSLARKRLEQIISRIMRAKIDEVLIKNNYTTADEKSDSFPQLEDLFTPDEITHYFPLRSNPKKNKVYYNQHELWYTVEINRGDVNWGKKLKLFPIDASIEIIHTNEFVLKDNDAYVTELFLHPSYPNDFAVNLKELKEKLKFFDLDPYNVRRFVIRVDDLEHLLQLNVVTRQIHKRASNN